MSLWFRLKSTLGLAMLLSPTAFSETEGTPIRIVNLGQLAPNRYSVAYSINNQGTVVGTAWNAQGWDRAVIWRNGSISELGCLPGAHAVYCTALGINAGGMAVGYGPNGEGINHGIVWTGEGSTIDLGAPPGHESFAQGINDHGDAVGVVTGVLPASSVWNVFVWNRATGMTVIQDLSGNTDTGPVFYPRAINNKLDIVGHYYYPNGYMRAFHWSKNSGRTDLPPLVGTVYNEAYAINSRGEIVGYTVLQDGSTHATMWSAKFHRAIDLGTLPGGRLSRAQAINDAGDVVGNSQTSTGQGHVVLWRAEKIVDIGALIQDSHSSGFGINNRGEIVGVSGNGISLNNFHATAWIVAYR